MPSADLHQPVDPLSSRIEAVLNAHASRVRVAARQYGADATDVDLVMQETRLRIWRLAERGEAPDDLSPGLIYRIAASAAIDIMRRRDSRREVSASAAATMVSREPDALERVALATALRTCFGKLLRGRRAVVAMYLRGSPREEIAALLRWSEGRTRNLLYRGLEDLRACLRTQGFEGGR